MIERAHDAELELLVKVCFPLHFLGTAEREPRFTVEDPPIVCLITRSIGVLDECLHYYYKS